MQVSEKGFSGFRKTDPMLFYPKPGDRPPLIFIPRTPQVVLGPLYLDGGGGPREARFRGGGGFPVLASRLQHTFQQRESPLNGALACSSLCAVSLLTILDDLVSVRARQMGHVVEGVCVGGLWDIV